jgi:hypothetical protein
MNKTSYEKYETFREYRKDCVIIKKMIDYIQLFGEVNREIILNDLDKKRRNKSTRRQVVTDHFVNATECLEKINEILNTIYVKSISEVKHIEGVDLPKE